ncbi:MAG TPA: hypothetical protein VFE47_20335 [Tepidisphaeraceae bacterium]|jgi:hypothetical protein|nr:hypothetical protein [Tepidisphaeraceae bacterium]
MSYDLFFRRRTSRQSVSRQDLDAYFSDRPSWTTESPQASYSNEDTGVYFSFFHSDARETDGDDEVEPHPLALPIAFNLNYFRPHPFGLEAETEVGEFVRHFDLTISDPQTSGMGDGEYFAEGFLRGWNAGNAFAYSAIGAMDGPREYFSLPGDLIEAGWRWNLNRNLRAEELEIDLVAAFVPRVMFLNYDGNLNTAVVWGDGIPILLPDVDRVIVPRKELAPGADDVVFFTREEIQPLVSGFEKVPGEPSFHRLIYEQPPAAIRQAIRNKAVPATKPKIIPFDQVLNQELLSQSAMD